MGHRDLRHVYKQKFRPAGALGFADPHLEKLMLEELRNSCRPGQVGGFLPGVKQIANVAALPGIVGRSVGLPDVHSGYGFAIGNMAAFDMEVCSMSHVSTEVVSVFVF